MSRVHCVVCVVVACCVCYPYGVCGLLFVVRGCSLFVVCKLAYWLLTLLVVCGSSCFVCSMRFDVYCL